MAQRSAPAIQLMKMYSEYIKNPSIYFNCGLINDNPFHWRLIINGVDGTELEGGLFHAELKFPDTFPIDPPKMFFKCPMWHPNIDKDTGEVCISTLHRAGVDELNEQELAIERWNPTNSVEAIVISVLLMLQEPNPESPLNVEANRDFMQHKDKYKRKFKECVQNSIEYL